jgi:hypothetical protein
MFERLARFRIVRSRDPAPALAQFAPANDNLMNFRKPGQGRRIPRPALVGRWSVRGGGMRLGCRWQAEPPAQSVLEDFDPESTRMQICRPRAIRPNGHRDLRTLTLKVRQ